MTTTDRQPVITMSSVVTHGGRQVTADLNGEIVMMSAEKGNYYALQGVGGRIWAMLGTPIAVTDIVARLAHDYEVDPATCEGDVLAFLNALLDHELITVET